jgi:precorrin-6A/cobalt-precorrin-6A reductase
MTDRLVLVVGGTGEARELAAALHGSPGLSVLSSLAGVVARPRLPVGPVRVGGFGGAEGLRRWLGEHRPAAVVDASHPFAARISASCSAACRETGVPLLRLERPPWTAVPGDRWHLVADVPTAAARTAALLADLAPSRAGLVLVTTGRRDLTAFADLSGPRGHRVLARCVDPPTTPMAGHVEILLDRGPYTEDGESALLRERAVDILVTKNSGGPLVAAKLTATRTLGVPVVMVDRPPTPPHPPPTVADVPDALAWAQATASNPPP